MTQETSPWTPKPGKLSRADAAYTAEAAYDVAEKECKRFEKTEAEIPLLATSLGLSGEDIEALKHLLARVRFALEDRTSRIENAMHEAQRGASGPSLFEKETSA